MESKSNAVAQAAGTEVSFFMPNTDSLAQLESLKPKFSLTLKYKTADDWAAIKDKSVRCFYMGIKEIPNEYGEIIKCGVFVSETECFIAGQMILVDAVSKLEAKTPVEIIYRGKSQNKATNGSTMKFDVNTLG